MHGKDIIHPSGPLIEVQLGGHKSRFHCIN